MHRKVKSRARQTRRSKAKHLQMAKEKIFTAEIRRLTRAHNQETERLYRTLRWNERNDDLYASTMVTMRRTAEDLTEAVNELTEEVQSLKRMTHAETVLRANVKPEEKPNAENAGQDDGSPTDQGTHPRALPEDVSQRE